MAVTTFDVTPSGFRVVDHGIVSTPDELWAAEHCREALGHLERAITASPLRSSREAGKAAMNLIVMQEMMAHFQRKETDGRVLEKWRTLDEHLNQALGLIGNTELPYPGVGRKQLAQARDMIYKILMDGLL